MLTLEKNFSVELGSVHAQSAWSQTPISHRLKIIRKLRHLIAGNASSLAAAAAAVSDRPLAEKLVSEVLPLADACRWLERNAARVLAPQRHGRSGRPFWLQGVTLEIQRQPFGNVLVIGPGNYPLFLPAIHTLQALVAGNAVQLKPAPGTRNVAQALARLAVSAGLNPALLTILPEHVEAARRAIDSGVDKVVFTGSSENGRDVLAHLAETNTPSVMELSGEDPVLVLADADLDLVVRSLTFGTCLNNGETCIAPRRLIVVESVADILLTRMKKTRIPIERVPDLDAGVALINQAEFALGASIFSADIGLAQIAAARIQNGVVIINDLIAPTADPRLPFGGARASGFGSTRGAEGLLEMTRPHSVIVRRGRGRPHLDAPTKEDAALFINYIRVTHGSRPFAAVCQLIQAIIKVANERKKKS